MRTKSFVLSGLAAALIAGWALCAYAQEENPGYASAHERARDAGSTEGRVLFADRMRGRILLESPNGKLDIMVLPSTTIAERDGEFHTIADIRRGQRVQVFLSKRGGVYFAQIIRLRGER